MEITTEREKGVLIALAGGRLDGSNAGDFERVVQAAVGDCEGAVILDCENISYFSSTGLRAMLAIAKALARRNVAFALCSLSDPVARVFQVSGFDRIIPTFRSRVEALGAVGS